VKAAINGETTTTELISTGPAGTPVITVQPPPCPVNCRPILPTTALFFQLQPHPALCPANCRPILSTAALSCQLPPYPANCRPILHRVLPIAALSRGVDGNNHGAIFEVSGRRNCGNPTRPTSRQMLIPNATPLHQPYTLNTTPSTPRPDL